MRRQSREPRKQQQESRKQQRGPQEQQQLAHTAAAPRRPVTAGKRAAPANRPATSLREHGGDDSSGEDSGAAQSPVTEAQAAGVAAEGAARSRNATGQAQRDATNQPAASADDHVAAAADVWTYAGPASSESLGQPPGGDARLETSAGEQAAEQQPSAPGLAQQTGAGAADTIEQTSLRVGSDGPSHKCAAPASTLSSFQFLLLLLAVELLLLALCYVDYIDLSDIGRTRDRWLQWWHPSVGQWPLQ